LIRRKAVFVEAGAGLNRRCRQVLAAPGRDRARARGAARRPGNRRHIHAAQGHLDEGIARKEVRAAQQQRVHGIRGGFRRLPILRLLLFEQPDPAFLHRRRVGQDFVKGLNHQGLGLEGRAIPPPAPLGIAPEPAQLLIPHAAFLERLQNVAGRGSVGGVKVAKAMEGESQVALGLAAVGLEPELPGLLEEEVNHRPVWGRDRQVFAKEAAAVEIQRVRGAGDMLFRLRPLLDARIAFRHPGIQPAQRAEDGGRVQAHAQVPEAAKAGGDIERDVIIAAPAREPRPGAVVQLLPGQLLQGGFLFVGEAVVIEQDAEIAAGLALLIGLPQPGGFFEHHRLEVRVPLEGAFERGRVLPEIEEAADFGIGIGDEARQGIGVQAVESLLGAFVGGFHQVRQRQHRIPGRLGHHLRHQALVLARRRGAGFKQPGERERVGGRAANRQRQ